MTAWIVDHMLWIGAGGIAVIVGVKIIIVRIFNRLAEKSANEG